MVHNYDKRPMVVSGLLYIYIYIVPKINKKKCFYCNKSENPFTNKHMFTQNCIMFQKWYMGGGGQKSTKKVSPII